MARIVFLSCTKSKLDKPSQAQDLYSASPMFRKTLEYGKSLRPEKTFGQIKSAGIDPERDTFIFLAGTEYIKPLAKYIPEENIEEPMKGRRFGERLKWLNGQIEKIGEVIKKIKNMIYETYQRKFK